MVTSIYLNRYWLITKETMESYCKGEEIEQDSVNDDLESLFENIRLGKEPDEAVDTYFLPKLTEEELELVERKDASFLKTFIKSSNPDVNETDMMLSESDSKYIYHWSWRKTFVIKNFYETSSDTSSETSSKNSPAKQFSLKNYFNCSVQ